MRVLRYKAGGWKPVAPVFLWLTVCLIFLFCSQPGFSSEGDKDNVRFRWAFGALVKGKDAGERKLESVTQDRTLKTGDRFKMMVEPQTKCFVYLIYHNSQGEVKLLFPYALQQFANDYEISKRYYVPQGADLWLELDDHTGLETFYLLASVERLTGLENLLSKYDSSDTDKKPDIAKEILAEIHNLRKQHTELTTAAERPVRIGGTIRSLDKPKEGDISTISDEISSTDFYARTFTIEHQ